MILPSKSEPIGAVVQEAMANGCIPIVSDLV
ncbi:glycosyltransferase [bacterium]|nr:glycosyltransferase [bacterium]